MKWPTFLVAVLVAIVADASLTGALEVGGIWPRLTIGLVAFVALNTDPLTATWVALLAGGLMDLSEPSMTGPRSPHFLLGPHALGLAFGVQALVVLRGSVIRRNPLAMGAMAGVLCLADGLVWVALWTVRSWYPDSPAPWGDASSLGQFGRQVLQSLSTGIVAVGLGWLLTKSLPLWGFPSVLSRSRTQGGTARITRQ